MTHDELLANIDERTSYLGNTDGIYVALRAVVELHIADFGTPNEDILCDSCKVIYPCLTIQTIEKELK